ncbi:Molybdenum cofactor sulfurase [Cymbomonas tetramitiformis]|uniref:Molybdenum cofactor sulfurase n=1 Tax=Cymbomonas tetramitiformis TaxID=36881 RepID=A0AAE0CDM5_9CHLO|nr:Molybdenum cofactor sulfurase [Cymbomonas tetramitiformis]
MPKKKRNYKAEAWRGQVGQFGAECVLISPLRRAVETATLAFDGVEVPFELCRSARELWWSEQQNTLGTPEALAEVLRALPRGVDVVGLEEAFSASPDDPQTEEASIQLLRRVIGSRGEDCLAVVCHWGVINALCGSSAPNAAIIDCRRFPKSGHLQVVKHHDPPAANGAK